MKSTYNFYFFIRCQKGGRTEHFYSGLSRNSGAKAERNQIYQEKYLDCTVLYCTVLYCTVLYCTVLYCTVLYCTVLYCTVLYCTVLYCTALYCTVLDCTVLYCTVLYCTVLYCTLLYCTVLYSTVLYCTVLYCTALYCTVLYCTVLYGHKWNNFVQWFAASGSGYVHCWTGNAHGLALACAHSKGTWFVHSTCAFHTGYMCELVHPCCYSTDCPKFNCIRHWTFVH
jgi:hypothetical protein